MNTTARDIICNILSEQLGIPRKKITEASNLQLDLGADSLDKVEILMALEEAMHIELPENADEKVKTVGDIEKLVQPLLLKTKPRGHL